MHRHIYTVAIVGLVAGCGEKLDASGTSQGTTTAGGTTETSTGTAPTTGGQTGASTGLTGDGESSSGAADVGTGTGESTAGDGSSTGTTSGDDSSSGEPVGCGAPEFPDASAPPMFEACADIQAESRWCLTIGKDDTVTAIGLDSQTDCEVVALPMGAIETGAGVSLGVVGGEIFTCNTIQGNGVVVRVSLADGSVELSNVPCFTVTTWRGHPVVQGVDMRVAYDVYMDWDAVLQGTPSWQLPDLGNVESLAVEGDVLYGAWHSDDHFSKFEMPCGDTLGSVGLVGFDDWMTSIAVSADQRFYTFGNTYPGLRSFDASNGTVAEDWPDAPFDGHAGLACFTQ